MPGERVEDIVKGRPDSTGATIDTVYVKIGQTFAAYRTAERVMIQYADDQALGIEQRRALAPLNPLRGEINGLVDGWRSSDQPRDQFRARMFDRRTADALTAALQGDQVHAEELLRAVKADVLEERVSIGRAQYLSFATIAAIGVFVAFAAIALAQAQQLNTMGLAEFIQGENLWLAAGMGSLGALFSIALAIRARDIRTDLQRRDNISDAILRILIGAVSAIIIFSLLRSKFITIQGLAIDETGPGGEPLVPHVLILHAGIFIAFLAGFSERLVSGYLIRAADSAAGATIPGAGLTSAAAQAAAQTEVEATERNPRGKLEVEVLAATRGGAPGVAADAQPHMHGEDDDADGCVCDIAITPDEMTADVELPEASGGVEKSALAA